MRSTKFCALDRYRDFVSKEIIVAFTKCRNLQEKVLVAVLVRFRQCPRGMAGEIASACETSDDTNSQAIAVSREFRRSRCYRQTGITDKFLHKGVMAAVSRITQRQHYENWEALETVIAKAMKHFCQGTKMESFVSRQVAADLCRVPGFVGGLTKHRRPVTSKLGVGAKAGFYLAERAKGIQPRKIRLPVRVSYLKQTGLCEYHKLARRYNFHHLRLKNVYRG